MLSELFQPMCKAQQLSLNPCCNGRCSLRVRKRHSSLLIVTCLNPCCNGRCSLRLFFLYDRLAQLSLNPCRNGRCSLRLTYWPNSTTMLCLNPCCNGRCSLSCRTSMFRNIAACLNPCCNGRCSLSLKRESNRPCHRSVLILVVMENALWDRTVVCLFRAATLS